MTLSCFALLLSCGKSRASEEYPDFKIGENIVLRYWAPLWTSLRGAEDAGAFPLYQKLEELTGVTVLFEHPPTYSVSEQLEMLKSSNDLPDIIELRWLYYPGGPEQAIQDGMIERLNDHLKMNAPNLWRIITNNEEVARWASTMNGSYYTFPYVRFEPSARGWGVPYFKKDWLDAVGKTVPETLDQWHEVLAAFKEHSFETIGYGEEYPLLIVANKDLMTGDLEIPYLYASNMFACAFGTSHGFFFSDGEIVYGPLQPAYRDMLVTLATWYSEGLIHPILANPSHDIDSASLLIKTGVWIGSVRDASLASVFCQEEFPAFAA